MSYILTFAGSNSKASINKQLASYAANKIHDEEMKIVDLNDYTLPLYGIDLEVKEGIPDTANAFYNLIKESKGIVLSLAEHNGAYSSVFKNLIDWLSRIEGKFWSDKPMLLMATSPGGRGGTTVLEIASDRFPRHNANLISTFSLPSFNENFSENGIKDDNLNIILNEAIDNFKKAL
ncbi:NADPH-dependent FMN reductase [uncultured Lacinutrix sp.]|uniref:NADPH-dependent FMN reductase n=1 Tax=uncultured Lacinutrix sp. TaxID=574032 RepID=UPI00261354B1|nr:NAD(P)H-dependent oxidoreductase [uncultured Lacinutrix sp.]